MPKHKKKKKQIYAKKISKGQKKFIRNNYKKYTLEELAEKTDVQEKIIAAYLKKLGKKIVTKKSIKKARAEGSLNSISDLKKLIISNADVLLLILVMTIFVYLNAMNGELVSDDIPTYKNYPLIRDFWTSVKTVNIQKILYAIIYNLFKINQVPLHVMSLLFHLANIVLVFTFISLLFGRKISTIATALFAVHPINSETVCWISANFHLFSTMGFLITAISYILFKNSTKRKYLVISSLAFLITIIFTRDPKITVIPPLLILIDQFFIEEKINPKSLAATVPHLLITAGFLFYLRSTITLRIETIGGPGKEFTPYFTRLPYTIYMTAKFLIFPKDLALYHEEVVSKTLQKVMALVSIVLVLGVIALWKKNRKIAGLILFIFVSIGYALSPVQVAWFIAERYLYIGSFVFCIILALIFTHLEEKNKIKNLATILTFILLVIYSARSFRRTFDWKTRKNVWETTARVSPYSPRVHNNLGDVYALEGDFERSIAEFERSVELQPNYAEAIHNLGNTYLHIGQLDKAEKYLLQSVEVKPTLFQAHAKLGLIEYKRENLAKAEEYVLKALQINPGYLEAQKALQAIEQRKKELGL